MSLFRRRRFESEMEAEFRFHLDARIDDLVRSGLDRPTAERRARLEFGALEATKDDCRDAVGLRWLDDLRADLRLTLRTLRRQPAFATVAILSLALGIGANTAMFGLADAVILRLLPVRDPAQLVFLETVGTQGGNGGPPYPCFELLRDKARSFDGMAAFSASNMEIVETTREQVSGLWVSGNFYDVLGVRPVLGRALSAADDTIIGQGGPDGPVVVISDTYWRTRFGADRSIIGRRLRAFDFDVTVVGVLPASAMSVEPGRRIDIAAPMMLSDPGTLRNKGSWWLDIVARLKPGVSTAQARDEIDALFQAYMADVGVSRSLRKANFDRMDVGPAGKGTDNLRTRFTKPLIALLILAGLVLLAACVNVASLMLGRASAREKEFAVRLAIGAGRGRIVRQTLTEALVLVAAGAGLGIALAVRGQAALAAFFETNQHLVLDLSMNRHMLWFTVAVSVFTAVAFGLLPALRAARTDPAGGLQAGSRSVAGTRSALRLGRALVVTQIAISTALTGAAGLFIRTVHQLEAVDPGYTKEGVLQMEVTPERRLNGKPEWTAMQREILDRVRTLPGVRAAAWSTMTPLSGRDRGVLVSSAQFPSLTEHGRSIHLVAASPEFFDTIGASLLVGRPFSARDTREAPAVAILNETAARAYFGSANPIGTRLRIDQRGVGIFLEIVGVTKDAKHSSLREDPKRFLYLPIGQAFDNINRLALSVRTSGDPLALSGATQTAVRTVSPTLLITNVTTARRQVEISLLQERLVSALSTAFGILALSLAAIGLYGILAYAVTRRSAEIGIRMALGATRNVILWSILRESLLLAAAGIAIGIPAALAVGRAARTLLYGVQPFDPVALTISAAVLLLAATAAGALPARRASRLDPMSALRCE
jgi:predicted permease